MDFRYTSRQWASFNPILDADDVGRESDTGKTKVGDGVTPWLTLPYFSPGGGGGGGGGLPAPDLVNGWQPGIALTSSQDFRIPQGTVTAVPYPFDTVYSPTNANNGATGLFDDEWIHWDPATPTQFTLKRAGWYWCSVLISIPLTSLALASAAEWIAQPVFGAVNQDPIHHQSSKVLILIEDSTLLYLGGGVGHLDLGRLDRLAGDPAIDIPITPNILWMSMVPLFS